jgi:arabinofuranosyltransferase
MFGRQPRGPGVAEAEAAPRGPAAPELAFLVGLTVFLVFAVTHAWVVDDAYITLRTVDNFVRGLGLRWNVDERVQSFTHPLWMFVLSAAYAVTRESFFTTLVVSFFFSVTAVLVTARWLRAHAGPWAPALFVAVLLGSKAFLDFSSSGLENPLTHLLLALFFGRFLFPAVPWPSAPRDQLGWLFLIAAFGFVNRQDTILLFGPACAWVLWGKFRQGQWRAAVTALLTFSPAVAWSVFAFLYYGSIVPNTAYAKLAGPRLNTAERFRVGLTYYLDSLHIDVATLPMCGLAVWLLIRRKEARFVCIAVGVIAYLLYVLAAGAVGTHMSGRFFSAPVFLAAISLAFLLRARSQMGLLGGFSALLLLAAPFSPIRVGSSLYAHDTVAGANDPVIDTRQYVLHEGAALLNYRAGRSMPAHAAYAAGKALRRAPDRVVEGGPGSGFQLMVGYSGFAAGPDKHIIDVLGLTDPLIARLPLAVGAAWGPGHFLRSMPAGYKTSIEQRRNVVADPDLRAYNDALWAITRDPLFSARRLGILLKFAAGSYEHHLRAYAKAQGLRAP